MGGQACISPPFETSFLNQLHFIPSRKPTTNVCWPQPGTDESSQEEKQTPRHALLQRAEKGGWGRQGRGRGLSHTVCGLSAGHLTHTHTFTTHTHTTTHTCHTPHARTHTHTHTHTLFLPWGYLKETHKTVCSAMGVCQPVSCLKKHLFASGHRETGRVQTEVATLSWSQTFQHLRCWNGTRTSTHLLPRPCC